MYAFSAQVPQPSCHDLHRSKKRRPHSENCRGTRRLSLCGG